MDAVRAVGADHVIDYTSHAFADGTQRYDVILDIGGNRRLAHLRRALTRRGRLVVVGGETDGRWLGGADRQIRALALSPFAGQKLGTFVASENADDLIVLGELVGAGQLAPAIDRTYPLGEVAAAIRYSIGPPLHATVETDPQQLPRRHVHRRVIDRRAWTSKPAAVIVPLKAGPPHMILGSAGAQFSGQTNPREEAPAFNPDGQPQQRDDQP